MGTDLNEICFKIQEFELKDMNLEMSYSKWRSRLMSFLGFFVCLFFVSHFREFSQHSFVSASETRAPSQYPKRCLFVRSREVSNPRDWYFKLSYRFEIWQAHRQQCCRSAFQISERSDNSKYKPRGFETLRDLTKRRLFGYWDGAQMSAHHGHTVCEF